jgi:phage FluMu protein Com
MRCGRCEKELHECKCVWAIPIVCQRCGEVNPADIHTCTPIENLTTEKNLQISDSNG